MIIELIILLFLTLFTLVIFAYIMTYKEYIFQKLKNKKKELQKDNNNIINNKKEIFIILQMITLFIPSQNRSKVKRLLY